MMRLSARFNSCGTVMDTSVGLYVQFVLYGFNLNGVFNNVFDIIYIYCVGAST